MHSCFFIRCDGKYIRINSREIQYIESLKNYVRIDSTTNSYLVLISLSQLEKELPASEFCRVHRSFIVSLHHVSSFDQGSVYIDRVVIPINPGYKNVLQSKVKVLVSETRSRVVE